MSGETEQEIIREAALALAKLRKLPNSGALLFSLLYKPDARLAGMLEEFKILAEKEKLTRAEATRIGNLLEQIALLAFTSLQGWTDVASFTSLTAQHDLLIHGSTLEWRELIASLHLEASTGQILVEAKATANPVDTAQFLRLCSIVHQMKTTVGLGVFLARSGATGFPSDPQHSQAAIGDARLTQVICHVGSERPVVVLNFEEILRLAEPGSLPLMLERKIRDLIELSGRPTEPVEVKRAVRLPKHLRGLVEDTCDEIDEHDEDPEQKETPASA